MRLSQHPDATTLALSLELSSASWRVAATDGRRRRPSLFNAAADVAKARLEEVLALIDQLRGRWDLAQDVRVEVIYEAGQDGFWIARALEDRGIHVVVCDPASLPRARQARRAKTDRLDAIALLEHLLGWLRAERSAMRVVHAPRAEEEDWRHLARERGLLQKEIAQHRTRMRMLLRLEGCWIEPSADIAGLLRAGALRRWDDHPLSPALLRRLHAECERLAIVQQQFRELERTLVSLLPEDTQRRIEHLQMLRAVGAVGATRLVLELFWREFANRRQVGAAVGLVPQPYDSGQSHRDQGISKAANRRVRSLLVEMAWMWLRYQPRSELTRWFERRTASATPNKRARRIAIVAVARRLAIALWRFLRDGVVPAGAQLKA